MAAIHELLKQITDPALRERIAEEFERSTRGKKFGLVFEDHIPERLPLYGFEIKRGRTVAKKTGKISDTWQVIEVLDLKAHCRNQQTGAEEWFPLSDLVVVAEYNEPVYPALEPLDKVVNAPESTLWHTLIEGENYYALRLLEYLYAGKVDCIYIDPPYNTGTDEWKYNDAFVDSSDRFSHSKWLSLIKKRLIIAKRLLTQQGIIIISIGYQELHHLVLLCEELFPDRQVVPVTVQTSGGKPSRGFNYLQEYLVFITALSFTGGETNFSGGRKNAPYHGMNLATFTQEQRPNQVYPIFVDEKSGRIISCGKSLQERINDRSYVGNLSDFQYDYDEAPAGTVAVWPVSNKGEPCVWRLISSRFLNDLDKGYIKVIPLKSKNSPNVFSIQYLADGIIKKIMRGDVEIIGKEEINGTLILGENKSSGNAIPTIWTEKTFYTAKGTSQMQDIFGGKEFPYPKPIDLIVEILRATTNSESLVLDFFAGSGTTLNAVTLLNSQDDGHRRCILVTNNELSKSKTIQLKKENVLPGTDRWESYGICRSVTWPRIKYIITGMRDDGTLIDGFYSIDSNGYELPLSYGFAANCEFFHLTYLEKDQVALGQCFEDILPLLWLQSGAIGPRPSLPPSEELPEMLILPENRFAVLIDDMSYGEFSQAVKECGKIDHVYFVTNSDSAFKEMAEDLEINDAHQLYRDYVENFRISAGRMAA